MAVTKGIYDPVKAVEGMFNGSVTRIAYVLKDPINYGGSTKMVLAECAKRFQDALDDCEIQLLDAKWYLEHQLKTNQLRREAQAREMGTAAKRKHDEIKEANEPNSSGPTAAKKAKIDQEPGKAKPEEPAKPKDSTAVSNSVQSQSTSETKPTNTQPTAEKKNEQKKDETTAQPASKAAEVPKAENKDPPPTSTQDDFAKPTPPASTAGTNDDFNFESMFGEPTGGEGDISKIENDLDFFTTRDFAETAEDSYNQDSTSLDILLPGVETYANQTDDNPPSKQGNANNGEDSGGNTGVPDTGALPTFSNDFDLPDIGGPNIFDDFLNDDSLGGGGSFENNIDPNDTSLVDMDFDF